MAKKVVDSDEIKNTPEIEVESVPEETATVEPVEEDMPQTEMINVIDYEQMKNAIAEGIVEGFVKIVLFVILVGILLFIATPLLSMAMARVTGLF